MRPSDAGPAADLVTTPGGRWRDPEAWVRFGVWLLLLVSWPVAVAYMWEALTMVPDAARLDQTRLVAIPTPRRFFAATVLSGLELVFALAALWPWRARFYASRLAVTALALATWFVMTVPAEVSRMDWVHRRWLAFLVAASLAGLVATVGLRAARRALAAAR